MKKLFLSLIALFAVLSIAQAQPGPNDFWIHGNVTNSTTNAGIPNHQVLIFEPAENNTPGFTDTVYTDASGYYSYVVWGGSTIGPNRNYAARTVDCQNSPHYVTMMNNQGTTDAGEANFSICDISGTCHAGFTTQVANGNPLGWYFLSNSTASVGTITSWSWNYGDGTIVSNQPNISSYHNYTAPGTYYVCLTIGTSEGCTSTYCDTIVVTSPCANAAGIVNQSTSGGLAFFGYATWNGQIVNGASYSWNWGDGTPNTTSGPTAQHVYAQPGTYTVCVLITNNGCADDICQQVTVGSNNNSCMVALNPIVGEGPSFTFVSTANGTAPISYAYYVDGELVSTGPPTYTYTFGSYGGHSVCVVSTDANGCSATTCDSAYYANPCSAAFTVTPTSNPLHYIVSPTVSGGTWTITPGGNFLQPNPNGLIEFTNAGTYTICYLVTVNGVTCDHCTTLVVSSSNTGCTSNFTWSVNDDGYVVFNNISDSNNNGTITSYLWTFGDGTSSTLQTPIPHNFGSTTAHTVCLTISTSNGCQSTYCDSTVTGTNANCVAGFTYYAMQNNAFEYHFQSFNSSTPYLLEWTINGVLYTPAYDQEGFNIVFPDSGLYIVCLHISDNNGCQSHSCQNVSVGGSGNPSTGCNPHFTVNYNVNVLNGVQFLPAPNQTVTNFWSFGDGQTSTNGDPVHSYDHPGTYYVCHTISGNNCQATFCDSVVIGNGGNTTNSISGSVYTSNNTFASVAYVFLLQMDYPNSQILPADAGVVQNGGYLFSNVANGDYLVKAALTPNDPFYANRIPTYYTTAAYWFNADVITINNNSVTGADIHMIEANNPGGPGFIGGSVDWADTLRAAGNFAGATVLVEDMQGNMIMYAVADQNGNYNLANLAYGTYKLTADFPGVTGDPVYVTLTPFQPSASAVQILLGPTTVSVKEEASVIGTVNLFPNPTTDNATLVLETAKPAEINVTIVNLMGQTVGGQTVFTNAGKTIVQLSTDNLAQGIYTIILRDSKGVAKAQKLVKR